MFNGLIREIVEVVSFSGNSLRVRAKFRPEHIGDSIAINGACLSVTQILSDGFVVEISSETAASKQTNPLAGPHRRHEKRLLPRQSKAKGFFCLFSRPRARHVSFRIILNDL